MRIQIRQPAGESERFTLGAFDNQVGHEVPFTVEGEQGGTGLLVAAEVAKDGSYALLTFDVSDEEATS